MSTKVVRSMSDFARHRLDIDLECRCGHVETLDYGPVLAVFIKKSWPKNLGSALRRFRCSKCHGRPVRIGPHHR